MAAAIPVSLLNDFSEDARSTPHDHFFRRWHEVLNAPEGMLFAGRAEGDADVLVENWILGADENAVFVEVLDDLVGRANRIDHDEFGRRIDGAEHAGLHLVEEFLAVVGVRSTSSTRKDS